MTSSIYQPGTILPYVAIFVAVYLFLNGSLTTTPQSQSGVEQDYERPLSQDKKEALIYPDPNLKCDVIPHDIHVFSRSPLIIYIPDFLTKAESDHLIKISENKWEPSTFFNNGIETMDTTIRKSDKVMIDRDHTIQCIEQRALDFQGWPSDTFIERLWTQRYTATGHYAHHYDGGSGTKNAHRATTFMVYIQSNCTGGGTNFPYLTRPKDERWCEFVDCKEDEKNGVTFLPKAGAAVFWENFDSEGKIWKEVLHAGMPVESGVKVGLNIWSWYQKGHHAAIEKEAQAKDEL